MDSKPILIRVARALHEHDLEAVMIGNSAAALLGAPVTTIDVDFFIRKTPANIVKLKRVAATLNAVIFTPYYPVSGLYRLVGEDDGLQLDFMTAIHGVRSFNSLRSRAVEVDVEGEKILVADLADIIESKRAAGRPRDQAVLHALETTLQQKQAHPKGNPRRPQGGK
jgi:predicted nucleotidyltransferase